MNGDQSADEIYRKIQVSSEGWRNYVPPDQYERFVTRVQRAVKIYRGLVSPKNLRDELEALEKETRYNSATIGRLVSDLSPDAEKMLSISGPLPPAPKIASDQEQYRLDIRARLISAQRWRPEGHKRRLQTEIVGPPKKMGRPPDTTIDVLVSFICFAYAEVVGKPTTRSWDGEEGNPIETIVEDCLANLLVDDRHNAKNTVRRQITERDGSDKSDKSDKSEEPTELTH